MSRQSILGRDRVWSRPRVVLVTTGYFYVAMSQQNILCRDRVLAKARRFLIVIVYFRYRLWPRQKGSHVATKYFVSRQGVSKTKGPCVETKKFVS